MILPATMIQVVMMMDPVQMMRVKVMEEVIHLYQNMSLRILTKLMKNQKIQQQQWLNEENVGSSNLMNFQNGIESTDHQKMMAKGTKLKLNKLMLLQNHFEIKENLKYKKNNLLKLLNNKTQIIITQLTVQQKISLQKLAKLSLELGKQIIIST